MKFTFSSPAILIGPAASRTSLSRRAWDRSAARPAYATWTTSSVVGEPLERRREARLRVSGRATVAEAAVEGAGAKSLKLERV